MLSPETANEIDLDVRFVTVSFLFWARIYTLLNTAVYRVSMVSATRFCACFYKT